MPPVDLLRPFKHQSLLLWTITCVVLKSSHVSKFPSAKVSISLKGKIKELALINLIVLSNLALTKSFEIVSAVSLRLFL